MVFDDVLAVALTPWGLLVLGLVIGSFLNVVIHRLPLISAHGLDDVLAWRPSGPVTVRDFLADAQAVASVLPAGQGVLNLCEDRYHFAVLFAACVLAGKTSLQPASQSGVTLQRLAQEHPGAFGVVDGPFDVADLPCIDFPDLATLPRSPAQEMPMVEADRVVAIDALTMIAIGVIALLALSTAQPMLLDAAVVLALVSFLGTTAFILMFRRRGRGTDEAVTPPAPPEPDPLAEDDHQDRHGHTVALPVIQVVGQQLVVQIDVDMLPDQRRLVDDFVPVLVALLEGNRLVEREP